MSPISHKHFVQPIYEAIAIRVSRNLAADYFAMVMIDPLANEFELFISKKLGGELIQELETKLKESAPKSWIKHIRNKAPIVSMCVCDKTENPVVKIFKDALKCQKVLATPFEIEDIGGGFLIWNWHKTPGDYSKDYFEKAALITEQVALSLKLSLKERKGQELNAKLAALLELSTVIYSSLNYTEVLEKAIHLSMDIVEADGGTLFILDKKANVLKPLITVDDKHEQQISQITLQVGEGLTGLVAKSGVGLISNDSENDPRAVQVPGTPNEAESIISAPLTWSGEVIGVITLRSKKCKNFQQEDLDILTIFARQTADAIENAKLYESLDKAYQELANTQEQLIMTEKLRALGEMAGGVAHDFNNVLGTILGRTQLLLREVTDPKLVKHLKSIEKMTLAGAKTVQRMQNFTRVSSGGQYEQIDLVKVIEDAIEMTRPRWKDQCQREGIIIDLLFENDGRQPILGNPVELVEAISNLILNSVDASIKGGLIRISALTQGDHVVVKISDNGVGMDDATMKRIFFPFFTTKGKQGTGMGLSVVYGIITRHKGEIDVSSKVGVGTTFSLIFPICTEISAKAETQATIGGNIKARILLIDDDENIRMVISEMLAFLGHRVTEAPNGEEGVRLFDKEDFGLVITDLGMPGLSGWDVASMCKNLKPNVPIVMISGWGNQIDDDMVTRGHLEAVLAKPFEMAKIKVILDQVLSKAANSAISDLTAKS